MQVGTTGTASSVAGAAGSGDCLDVSHVCSAAPAEYLEVRVPCNEVDVQLGKLSRVAVIELLCFVELGVARTRRVRPEERDATDGGGLCGRARRRNGRDARS